MKSVLRQPRFWLVIGIVVTTVGLIRFIDILYGSNTFEGDAERAIYVSRGQTFASIVDTLETCGIIRNRSEFVFVGKLLGGAGRMQIGKYVVSSGISNYDLFTMIRDGRGVRLISVTIPEGLRARSHARILARTVGLDSARFVEMVYDNEFTRSLGIEAHSLEGYLLPETYGFYWQPDEKDVIIRLVDQFKKVYTDSLQERAQGLGWTTAQVMTLASIVEGETVLGEERETISGVYHNRLRKRMPLQADPTIQYMIEDGPRRVLYSDLKLDHPYNTYRNRGLPPGPVNNPGKASILAALYPVRHNYLFFVANGKGGHWFSTNFEDHKRHVRQFRRNRRLELRATAQNGQGPSSDLRRN